MSAEKVQPSKEFEGVSFDLDFLEDALYELICRMFYFERFVLSNQMIKLMALQFQTFLRLESYSATEAWIENFRKKYNLPLYTDFNIGYKERKSVQVCDIIRELLHTREINKILKTNEPIKAPVTNENSLTITPKTKVAVAVDTTTINVQKKPTRNSKIIDIEEELPRSICTTFGTSTIQKTNEKSSKPVYTDMYDIEKFLPATMCSVPQQEQQHGNIYQNPKKEIVLEQCAIGNDISLSSQISLASEVNPHNQVVICPLQIIPIIPISTPIPPNCHVKPDFIKTNRISNATLKNPQQKRKSTKFSQRVGLQTREEALRYIKLLEEFAMLKENFRLIGFIERLEQVIKNSN